jgi:hypothetical protein
MMQGQRHLSDDRLIEVCLDRRAAADEERHLLECKRCEERRAGVVRMLDEISEAAAVESDGAFPPERLAKQRLRIMHRIEQDGRPARVIVFPASAQEAWIPRRRPAMRWLAGAAAAGLVVGLVAGHYSRQLPRAGSIADREAVVSSSGVSLRPATATITISDDEFLDQVESALESPSASVLRPLDELTPLAWDSQ